jgi:hypothetical protein
MGCFSKRLLLPLLTKDRTVICDAIGPSQVTIHQEARLVHAVATSTDTARNRTAEIPRPFQTLSPSLDIDDILDTRITLSCFKVAKAFSFMTYIERFPTGGTD